MLISWTNLSSSSIFNFSYKSSTFPFSYFSPTIECVNSIKQNTSENNFIYEIVVVDNKSTNESVSKLKEIEGITLIQAQENSGFSAGNNIGIRYALDCKCTFSSTRWCTFFMIYYSIQTDSNRIIVAIKYKLKHQEEKLEALKKGIIEGRKFVKNGKE